MDDLRKRIKRLGRRPSRRSPPPQASTIDQLEGAHVEETPFGEVFSIIDTLEANKLHGAQRLGEWLTHSPQTAARVGNDGTLQHVEVGDLLFIDTETTGLGGGAMAFQVGVAEFNPAGDVELRQYFLRTPGEETAMLHSLGQKIEAKSGLVTFNGRSFDVPLLAGRFIMNRLPSGINSMPHFDLLGASRRLWSRRLDSCALSALERDVLGVRRTDDDVQGALIPWLYRSYLNSGDATSMKRVLYHNRVDLLSMVTLATTLCAYFTAPTIYALHEDDQLSLGKWYARLGMDAEAEQIYEGLIATAEDETALYDGLEALASLLKRLDRRDEACPYWEQMTRLRVDVSPFEELAKYYEWHAVDLRQALKWTEQGLMLIDSGPRHKKALSALSHRRNRLLDKLGD